jgi:hypothetical protein
VTVTVIRESEKESEKGRESCISRHLKIKHSTRTHKCHGAGTVYFVFTLRARLITQVTVLALSEHHRCKALSNLDTRLKFSMLYAINQIENTQRA